MTLQIQKSKEQTLKSIIIVAVGVLLVISITYLSMQQYRQYRQRVRNDQVAQDVASQAKAAVVTTKKAQFNADVSRLVSICMNEQQRYDTLAVKDQAKTPRPNCAISQE